MAALNPFSTSINNYIYLYTKGGQFSLNGKEYIGEYHFDGTTARVGPVPPKPNEPEASILRRLYNNPDHYDYDRIKQFAIPVLQHTEPQPYLYTPQESAYSVGFDARYFVEKVNDEKSFALEISQAEANRHGKANGIDAGLYPMVIIQWKLTGKSEDIIRHNQLQLYKASAKVPSIEYTVKNFLEHARITLSSAPNEVSTVTDYPNIIKNKYRKLLSGLT